VSPEQGAVSAQCAVSVARSRAQQRGRAHRLCRGCHRNRGNRDSRWRNCNNHSRAFRSCSSRVRPLKLSCASFLCPPPPAPPPAPPPGLHCGAGHRRVYGP
jgi:hypothetical protein